MAHDEAAHAGFGPELRIDWLAIPTNGGTIELGLTILPGKRGRSIRYPGREYTRDADADLAALHHAGVRTLILLVEDVELERWGDVDLVERGVRQDVQVMRHPIPDGAPPVSVDAMRGILSEIRAGWERGRVAVACMGGVGRTGTVAACALVAAGADADDAIARVRAVRHPSAVETAAQEAFVRSFATSVGR